jgi:hypothetical protein
VGGPDRDRQDEDGQAVVVVRDLRRLGDYQSIYVRTEPLTYYWGYYDSLSETDVGAFEKTLAKDRKNRGLPPL